MERKEGEQMFVLALSKFVYLTTSNFSIVKNKTIAIKALFQPE